MPNSENTQEGEPNKAEISAERQSLLQSIDQWLDPPLAFLSLIWVVLLLVELTVPLSPEDSSRVFRVDFAIWLIFVVDFVLEFVIAPDKLRYLRSNILVALSLVFPFIRVFRVFPFLRSLRAISLFRLTLIANRGAAALNDIFRRRHLQYVLSLSGLVASLAAVGTYYFERGVPGTAFLSFGDAVWWAASMVTTINTSIDPITFEGRVIGLLLRAYAMAVFGYVAASIASYLIGQESTEKESIENDERRAEREAIDRLSHEMERLSAMLDHQLPIEESSLESEQEEKQ